MKVLVAPLDWGLGHASRCVPVINEFLRAGADVELGVCGNIGAFYKDVFPQLKMHRIPSYKIHYPKHGYQMPAWVLTELPRIMKVIAVENAVAESLVRRENFDIVFSDNRFGFYSKKVKSIYMTHQLRIAFPGVTRIFEAIGVKFHQRQMQNFSEIWVPDFEKYPGLGGRLSHLNEKNVVGDFFKTRTLRYVGPLSRFSLTENFSTEKEFDFLGVVSGAEPMRTYLEMRLRKIFKQIPGSHALVLGRPGETSVKTDGNITLYSHLAPIPFARLVKSAKYFISRPGYSTVMDQAILSSNCLFVPTPGQTEQVYLSKFLESSSFARHIEERRLSAESVVQAFSGQERHIPLSESDDSLQRAVLAVIHQ